VTARGRVIVLNGTSSSGKSTLTRALQRRLDGAWLGLGIDTVVFALPKAYLDQPLWSEVFRYVPAEAGAAAPFRIETGELGTRLVDGLHRMIASLVDAGLSVIVDHVLLEPDWLPDLAARLEDHEVLFVGVRCPLETVVERERERRDRTIGQAAAQLDVVHRAGGYDLEVDTSILSPEAAADVIVEAVGRGFPKHAFARVGRSWRQARVPSAVRPAAGSGS
jgi:chloramphenicol 3-O phosphotransferase